MRTVYRTIILIAVILVVSALAACREKAPTVPPTITATLERPAETAEITAALPPGFRVVGYITHWNLDRLPEVNLKILTDLIWQGLEVTDSDDPTLVIAGGAPWSQVPRFVAAGHAAGLKVHISLIGVWDDPDLYEVWQSPSLRAKLIDDLKQVTLAYNADGIDLDNEGACDPALYSQFIRELHDALAPIGRTVTMAGNPYRVCIQPGAASYLEFIGLMTYDLYKGYGYPYHSTLKESIQAMDLWVKAGVPPGKLLMGIPFYGRDARTSAWQYRSIVEKYDPRPDQNTVFEPLAAGGIIWWNGPDLVEDKVRYTRRAGFGGVMVYEIGNDSPDKLSLLASVPKALSIPSVRGSSLFTAGTLERDGG